MEPAVRRRLAFAVFLLFGVLGPLTVLMESKLEPVSWKFVALQTTSIGGLAAGVVYFFDRKWLMILSIVFWLSLMVLNSGGVNFVYDPAVGLQVHMGKEVGFVDSGTNDVLHSTTLNELEMRNLYQQRAFLGILAMVLLVVGYTRFISVIRGEIRERTRLLTEVTIAQKLQASLIPAKDMNAGWCAVSGITIPTSEVGGDYYDHVRLSDTRVAVVIADVSGHGVGSGIVSAMLKSALYGQLRQDPQPAAVMRSLNTTLSFLMPKNMFVSCVYLLIDYEQKLITVSSAGHPPVLLCKLPDTTTRLLKTDGLALGMKNDARYSELRVPYAVGDRYILYTDGVLEAADGKGEEFGIDRVRNIFSGEGRANLSDPAAICSTVVDRIRRFSGSDTFRDDVTVIGVVLKQ